MRRFINASLLVVLPLLVGSYLIPVARGQAVVASASAKTDAALELAKQILAESKKDSEMMTKLTYLSDIIGPRLTGSAALKRANEWAGGKMREYGLSNVHQEAWTIPVGWERGTATGRIIEPDNGRSLSLASLGW